nr:hypothetical protein [Tanacetum cinerariifolium]
MIHEHSGLLLLRQNVIMIKYDDDEEPHARPNLGKKKKRKRTKELESSKKLSTTKETSKGKASSKGSKTGPAYNLLKGTCSITIELEYHFQECFNALTSKLDWNNLKGERYPFNMSKPLPLQGHLGHLTVAVDYFFNNYLEYLKSSNPERTYTTSIMKTKAARYEIERIEYMVPTLCSPTKVGYDKDALKGIKH